VRGSSAVLFAKGIPQSDRNAGRLPFAEVC